ncbi:MAG: hypothetical protein GAK30_03678 [Paracidovorax wautersii]|uniref:Tripartite-type tricarboxylate transporter, receptor component TctC n=1 Tax=Paracidovorax wautersii TaxID=1177982 RepID=A0A7V8JNN8_9BURK|nr:MAG: hypothetical protein GAK30_03678 [Paracidovorax wautersii]
MKTQTQRPAIHPDDSPCTRGTARAYSHRWMGMATLCLMAALSSAAYAQSSGTAWPSKPVRFIVPFAAGSFTDTAARALGKELTTRLGQPFVVENRTGVGGILANDAVAKSAGDGYTLLFTDSSYGVSSALYKKLPYDPLKDLAAVAQVAQSPAVLVARTGLPAKGLNAILATARKDPQALTFGSGGQGSSGHLAFEALLLQAGAKMTHIPYKGVSAAVMDVIGQRVDLAIGSVGSTRQFIEDGRVIGVALTGPGRNPSLPQVPTFAEQGMRDYNVVYWFGVLGPARLPAAQQESIAKAIKTAMDAPELKQLFERSGVALAYQNGPAFGSRIGNEIRMWTSVIEKANITAE